MSYVCQSLQFGDNVKRVPGQEIDPILSNPVAPIDIKLVDPATDDLWGLQFSYGPLRKLEGAFYLAGADVPAPLNEGAVIKSWYSPLGKGGGGHHILVLTPFIVGQDDAEFALVSDFVHFSETPLTPYSIDTDTLKNSSVLATVRPDLPEFEKLEVASECESHAIVIRTTTTQVIFDRLFVYAGSGIPVHRSITVSKGQSCFVLAIFRKVTTTSFNSVGTWDLPKIPRWEWPMIVTDIVNRILTKGSGEMFEHLSPKLIADSDPDELKKAIGLIGKRIAELENIKSMVSGLSARRSR